MTGLWVGLASLALVIIGTLLLCRRASKAAEARLRNKANQEVLDSVEHANTIDNRDDPIDDVRKRVQSRYKK